MYGYLDWTLLAAFLLSMILWIGRAASRRQIRSSWVYCGLGMTLWLLYRSQTGAGAAVAVAFTQLAVLQLGVATLEVLILRRFNAPKFVGEILLAGGYIVVLISLLSQVGANITGLIATSAVATAAIGLSLQDILVNFVGGVVLELEQTVKIGDWIRTEHYSGAVSAVSLRHTVIQTADNDTVLVPNSSLIRLPVTIVSRKHRRLIPFHLPYGCNPAQVVEAVGQALAASPINGVCAEPKPRCIIEEFHPSYVAFGVFAWLNDPSKEYLAVSAVLMRVHFVLARLGMPLVSISQTIELSPSQSASHDSDAKVARYVDILRSIPIFHVLPGEAASRLAPSLKHAVFAPGEVIIHQGEVGDSMYIVIHGTVDVHVNGPGGISEYLATLEAGQFFGEMSLLTGEKRSANVIAMTSVECLVIGKRSLTDLFDLYPELALDISGVIAERQADLAMTREKLDGEQKRVLAARGRGDVLQRIQRYFGIAESGTTVGT
jgi:small-conductance mechanosensitive channel/CRP-like cAMP-binding protein